MKKVFIPLFSFLLVLTLLLGSFGSAKAAVGDDPVVTPVSGDMEFTTTVLPIASLPGLSEYHQMLVPAGFPAGEAQFEGAGVHVKGMDSGKATVCFSISTIAIKQGWGGKVGVWNGTKWVLLPTTITTTTDEAAGTTACAPITGSGTYAFIKYVKDASLLPTSRVLPECDSIGIDWDGWGLGSNGTFSPFVVNFLRLLIFYYPSLTNTPFEYFIIDANVPLTGDLHGSVISDEYGTADFTGFSWTYAGAPITSLTFTIHVVTPVCYHDFYVDFSGRLPNNN